MRRGKPLLFSGLLSAAYVAALVYNFASVPRTSVPLRPERSLTGPVDVIIVLGNPTEDDGTPSPEQRARVLEGVREFKRGVAPHMILTGGAVVNAFREGHMMALQAESQGVPASMIIEEVEARNTIQNIHHSVRIMQEHGWRSAEIVSSPSHLPRTGMILEHYRGPLLFPWRLHAAPWPAHRAVHEMMRYFLEANACLLFRVFGFPRTPYLPGAR